MTTTDGATTTGKGHKHVLTESDKVDAGLRRDIDDLEVATPAAIAAALAAHVAAYHADPDPEPPTPPATVTARSIAELYAALVNNEPDITLVPGTYTDRLYFDSRFAPRTVAGVIRCDGVTLNDGGMTFRGGVHDLDVQGLAFANRTVLDTGVIQFGGWDEAPAHRITVRRPKVLSTVRRTRAGSTTEHAVYFSHSRGGCHDILIEDLDVDATDLMGLASGIHSDHGGATGLVNAYNVTVRRLKFRGFGPAGPSVQYPIINWKPPIHDWTFDGARIENASGNAIRFESVGAQRVLFKDIVSTGSYGGRGFYSSMGTNPPGVTFQGCNLA